ncbi:UPF0764 protein C16orf89 homolog [Epargyreus clarus]|uniref:UPF0764 protein C16orf89 homolog n=1 Tax=Epargyreus clarus TaxID=520877 RepID=UPI003C2FE5D7
MKVLILSYLDLEYKKKQFLFHKCLISLSLAKEIGDGTSRRCRVSKSCYEMLQNGTDFGYALAHRLLFLQQARYGRGCSIFSEQKDKHMSQRFCSIAYQEAVYIAKHGFAIVDLLLEYVCLCALDGHAEFLRRSWLEKILRFQTLPGCFSQHAREKLKMFKFPTSSAWKIIHSRNHDILGGYCNGHSTALAASTLAMASRFIIESYY